MIARMLACIVLGALIGGGSGYLAGDHVGRNKATADCQREEIRRGVREPYADRDGNLGTRWKVKLRRARR